MQRGFESHPSSFLTIGCHIMKNIRNTTPILNKLLHKDIGEFREKILKFHEIFFSLAHAKGKIDYVKYCVSKFGKQNFVFTSERRWYVWEFEKYSLYVSNAGGVSIEVVEDLEKSESISVLDDAISRLTSV